MDNFASLIISFGMLCTTGIATYFAYKSATYARSSADTANASLGHARSSAEAANASLEHARLSAEAAQASVRLQVAHLRPQLQYSCSPIQATSDILKFTLTVTNQGPITAMFESLEIPIHSKRSGDVDWVITYLERAVVVKEEKRVVEVTVDRVQTVGKKGFDLLEKFKTDGGITVLAHYAAEDTPELSFSDSSLIRVFE